MLVPSFKYDITALNNEVTMLREAVPVIMWFFAVGKLDDKN